VLARLDELGVPAVALELPLTSLHADADHVRAALDGLPGGDGVVLVGHSYGGAVITDAGTHPAVEHLVYVSAFALDTSERVDLDIVPGGEGSELGEAVRLDGDGNAVLDLAAVPEVFYGDCEPVDVERALALLRPQPLDTWRQTPRAVAWRERPSTYVVCTGDRALPVAWQRNIAARIPGVAVVELPGASHSPFLSRPGELVDVLVALA
jgi:pimeloyl-ACP methyl ester carboxylesterase